MSKPKTIEDRMRRLLTACDDVLYYVDEVNRFDRSSYLIPLRSLRALQRAVDREPLHEPPSEVGAPNA